MESALATLAGCVEGDNNVLKERMKLALQQTLSKGQQK